MESGFTKKDRDNIELLDCYVMQHARFMDACDLVSECHYPNTNKLTQT